MVSTYLENRINYFDKFCFTVTPRDILTAASCVQNLTAIQITAAVGLNSDYAEYSINNIIIHTNYNPATGLYDLAILRTSVDIALNANVGVACMPITMIGSIPDNLAVSQVADTTYLNTATTLYRTTAPCNGESFFCTKSTVTPACGVRIFALVILFRKCYDFFL